VSLLLEEDRMKNPIITKAVLIALTSAVFIGLVIAVLNTNASTPKKDSYVEVGGNKIVYVPRTAQYVKFNGQVRKIVRFASTLSVGTEKCGCPNCCNGYCYVIVCTDSVPGTAPILPLSILWVSCT
jgi:hypothetical protein